MIIPCLLKIVLKQKNVHSVSLRNLTKKIQTFLFILHCMIPSATEGFAKLLFTVPYGTQKLHISTERIGE
jgi:hypothetical protein